MEAKLVRIAKNAPDEFGRAAYQEFQVERTEVVRSTPKDKGLLRASIKLEGPERRGRVILISITAGGPSAWYAVYVHERMDVLHRVGGAKYIERPLMQSAPYMASRIGRRIDLNRMMK